MRSPTRTAAAPNTQRDLKMQSQLENDDVSLVEVGRTDPRDNNWQLSVTGNGGDLGQD